MSDSVSTVSEPWGKFKIFKRGSLFPSARSPRLCVRSGYGVIALTVLGLVVGCSKGGDAAVSGEAQLRMKARCAEAGQKARRDSTMAAGQPQLSVRTHVCSDAGNHYPASDMREVSPGAVAAVGCAGLAGNGIARSQRLHRLAWPQRAKIPPFNKMARRARRRCRSRMAARTPRRSTSRTVKPLA